VTWVVGQLLTACNKIGAVVCSLPWRRSLRELDGLLSSGVMA